MSQPPRTIKQHLLNVFDELMQHDGYGEFRVEVRILKRGQKEVLLHYGKQYRYVIDSYPSAVRVVPEVGQGAERLLVEPKERGREEQGA